MFKIGEFSRLAQVPIKTLRYYDEIGLLKPEQVDRFTDYRYYSAAQLPRLNRILAYKDLGFTLDEIRRLLHEDISAEQLRGMLRLKRAEIRERVDEEQARLARVEARLRLIEEEQTMSNYEVTLKQVPSQRVASIRTVVPAYNQQDPVWQELLGVLGAQQVKLLEPCFCLYHDDGSKPQGPEIEVCQPFEGALKEAGRVKVRTLDAVPQVASAVHHGSFDTLSSAYQQLMKWIETNGYRIVGPARDVYLHNSQPIRQDDPSYVTEIQAPVQKI